MPGTDVTISADPIPQSRLQRAADLRIAFELRALSEWLSLRLSGVYYGYGIPHGDGGAVVLVPGFLTSDRYMTVMRRWLKRIGYRPYESGIGRNIRCPDLLVERLLLTIDQAYLETGRKVRLLGHSLGGSLARAAAARAPDKVEQVVTLGSPQAYAEMHPLIFTITRLVGEGERRRPTRPPECYTDSCTCEFARAAGEQLPPSVRGASLFTKSDGVVDWRCCLDRTGHPNIEVPGSHLGLVFNRHVYQEVARLFAGA